MDPQTPGTVTEDVLAARGGDEGALARLIERYQPALERRAVRRLGRRGTELETPQELALGVFADMYEQLTTDKTWAMTVLNRDSLRSMLFTVLLSKMVDAARYSGAAKRTGTVQESTLDLPNGTTFEELSSGGSDPAGDVLSEEAIREMQAVVAERFPEGLRVMAYFLQDYTQAEIAREFGWTEAKVRRAKERIECLLRPWRDSGKSNLARHGVTAGEATP